MRPAIFLRVAAVLTLIHGVLHTIGGVFGGAAPGVQQAALDVMKTNRFDALGASRTYWDFYFGYGLFLSVVFLVEAVVFWQLASIVKSHPALVRPIAATFCLGYVATAVISGRHFFMAPVVVELLIALCLAGAFVTAARQE